VNVIPDQISFVLYKEDKTIYQGQTFANWTNVYLDVYGWSSIIHLPSTPQKITIAWKVVVNNITEYFIDMIEGI
jgi:hypothetical protein